MTRLKAKINGKWITGESAQQLVNNVLNKQEEKNKSGKTVNITNIIHIKYQINEYLTEILFLLTNIVITNNNINKNITASISNSSAIIYTS